MTDKEFFVKIQDVLEAEGSIDAGTDLTDFEEYDSLGILNLMTFFDEIGVEVSQNDFADVATGADLLRLAGSKIDG